MNLSPPPPPKKKKNKTKKNTHTQWIRAAVRSKAVVPLLSIRYCLLLPLWDSVIA